MNLKKSSVRIDFIKAELSKDYKDFEIYEVREFLRKRNFRGY